MQRVVMRCVVRHFNSNIRVPFVPTPDMGVEIALAMALRHVGEGRVFADLGCGDGSLVARAIEMGFKRAIGIEDSTDLVVQARQTTSSLPVALQQAVEIRHEDLFRADVKGIDVIYVYLAPQAITRLQTILAAQMLPGSVVVSCAYPFETTPHWRQLESQVWCDLRWFCYQRTNPTEV